MRIGVDATCWSNTRGYGRFARELISAVVAQAPDDVFICLGDRAAFDAHQLRAPNVEYHLVDQAVSPTIAAAADGARSVGDMWAMTRAVSATRPDVFFSPSVYTYFPLPIGQRAVVTIHDAIAERFPALTLPSPRARLFWKLKVWLALQQARLVLTVSDYAAGELQRVLQVPRRRLRVCGEAPAEVYQPAPPAEVAAQRLSAGVGTAPYFVYVGGFNPHKRLDTVIEAHARVVAQRPDAPPHLLLVGRISGDVFHGEGERLRELIARHGTGSLVHFTGFVPDEALARLHTGAVAVVLVSESEGFGLPAVEGAACGVPVIATRESPLPQLLPKGGLFIRPGEIDEIAGAMRALLDDPARQRRMGLVALTEARALSWDAAARATLAALREAAA